MICEKTKPRVELGHNNIAVAMMMFGEIKQQAVDNLLV